MLVLSRPRTSSLSYVSLNSLKYREHITSSLRYMAVFEIQEYLYVTNASSSLMDVLCLLGFHVVSKLDFVEGCYIFDHFIHLCIQ